MSVNRNVRVPVGKLEPVGGAYKLHLRRLAAHHADIALALQGINLDGDDQATGRSAVDPKNV